MKKVYIDGQNFLYKAADVLIKHGSVSSKNELTKIDMRSLFEDVARRLRNTLNNQGIIFREIGKLKVRDSDVCHNCQHRDLRMQEKGVDVGMAVDIVVDACNGAIDEVVLVSSDTDLLPAIQAAKAQAVKVTYVGFSDKMTKAIARQADASVVMSDQGIIEAFDRYNTTSK